MKGDLFHCLVTKRKQQEKCSMDKVHADLGKLWKLIMQFYKTWKVLVKEKFFKMAMETF